MKDQHVRVKSTSSLLEIINHLDCLVQSLKKRSISITTSRNAILLRPQETVRMKLAAGVKAEKEALRERLVLEMKWEIHEDSLSDVVGCRVDDLFPRKAKDQDEANETPAIIPQHETEAPPSCTVLPQKKTGSFLSEMPARKEAETAPPKTSETRKRRSAAPKLGRR